MSQILVHEYCCTVGDFSTKKFHGIAWKMSYKCENDTIVFIPEESHWNGNKSQLSIRPGVGTNLVKNKLLADFSFRIGRFGTQKGILKVNQYISYNLLYNFNDNNNFQLSHCLSLGYRYNLSNNLNYYNWIGFEIGYLINSNEDFFKTPTFRFGTLIELKQKITLSPCIYFDDGFKKVYPGIRIGIDIGPW